MILPNNTGGFMLQTMLYLANQRPNESTFHELYNLPPGMDPAGKFFYPHVSREITVIKQ